MSTTFFSIQVMEIDIMGKSIDENRPVPVLRAEDRAVAWHGMAWEGAMLIRGINHHWRAPSGRPALT